MSIMYIWMFAAALLLSLHLLTHCTDATHNREQAEHFRNQIYFVQSYKLYTITQQLLWQLNCNWQLILQITASIYTLHTFHVHGKHVCWRYRHSYLHRRFNKIENKNHCYTHGDFISYEVQILLIFPDTLDDRFKIFIYTLFLI